MTEPDWTRDEMTYGETLRPAMKVQTKEEAAAYFENYVAWMVRTAGLTQEKAESNARVNIGYFTGYYDSETAARVQEAFGFGHPMFETSRPSAVEALAIGKARANAT